MDISSSLAGISTALTIVKQLKDIDKNFDEAAFKLQIVDLMSALAEVKIDLSDSKILLDQKDKIIHDLQQSLKFRVEQTVKHNGYTYGLDEEGNPLKYPYCQACEQSGNYIILQHAAMRKVECPKCKGIYKGRKEHPTTRRKEPEQVSSGPKVIKG